MNCKKLFFVLFFSVTCFIPSAQSLAELYKQRNSTTGIIARIDLTNLIANELRLLSPDSAIKEAAANLQLAQAAGYEKGECAALLSLCYSNNLKAKYLLAFDDAQKAMAIAEKLNNDSLKAYCYLLYSSYHFNVSNYDDAIEQGLTAIKNFEKKGIKDGIIKCKNLLAQVYQLKNDLPKAETLLQENLLQFDKISDSRIKAATLHTYANTLGMQGKYNEALETDKKGIELCGEAEEMKFYLSQFFDNIANCNMYSNHFADAKKYFIKSLVIDSSYGNSKQMSDTYLNLGNLALLQKNYNEAAADLQHSIMLAQKSGYKQAIYQAWQLLSDVYKQTGNTAEAMTALKKAYSVKDSIINEKSESKIAELETVFQTEKKEQQLKFQKAEIIKKNFLLMGVLVLSTLSAFAGLMLYRKKKIQNELRLQTAVMEQQNMATRAVISAEENERKRIAADLHDGIGQTMSAAKMNLSAIESDFVFSGDEQKKSFEKIIDMVDECCKEIRSVSHQMMPNALLKSGLASAVREFINKIDARVLKINLHTEGLNERLDSNVETVLYRVIQECVNNVIKHSGANMLDISLLKDGDGIAATIEDNGKGFEMASLENKEGLGIKNIKSRINFLKGTVEIDSSPNNGTLIAIHVPIV
jgi:two-component system NarL family sensor kinase